MAGLYLSSIRNTAMHTLGVYLLIGMAALTVGSFLEPAIGPAYQK